MKVKAFKIRLHEEHLPADQETLNNFMSGVLIKKTAVEMVHDQYWSALVFFEEGPVTNAAPATKAEKIFLPSETDLSEDDSRIYSALKQWRFDKASLVGIPSYLISSNGELITIAKVKPKTVNELAQIKGYGGQKIAKYGEEIIALLNSVC